MGVNEPPPPGLTTRAKVVAGAFIGVLYAVGMALRGSVFPGIVGGILAGAHGLIVAKGRRAPKPDLATLRATPWLEKTALVLCDVNWQSAAGKGISWRNQISGYAATARGYAGLAAGNGSRDGKSAIPKPLGRSRDAPSNGLGPEEIIALHTEAVEGLLLELSAREQMRP